MPYGSNIIKGMLVIKRARKLSKEATLLSEVLGTGTDFIAINEMEKGAIENIFDQLKKGGRGMTVAKREEIGRDMLAEVFYNPKGTKEYIKDFANKKFQDAISKFDIKSNLRAKIEDIIKDFDLKGKTKKYIEGQLDKLKNKVDPRKNKHVLKIQNLLSGRGRLWTDQAEPYNIIGLPKSSWINKTIYWNEDRKEVLVMGMIVPNVTEAKWTILRDFQGFVPYNGWGTYINRAIAHRKQWIKP